MIGRYSTYFLLPLIFIFFTGCDLFGSAEKNSKIEIRSEKNQYQIGQEADFSVTNESDEPLFVQFCGPYLISEIQRYDESWKSHDGTICPHIYTIGFESVAEPGETFRFSNSMSEEGRYRAKLRYRIGLEGESQTGYSSTFTVKE
jgi:hypothetical protein